MSHILFVPIHLDALFLSKNKQVIAAKADFTRLPYRSDAGDRNSNTPHISESVLEEEFENQNLTLKAGVHLHWALPDALTHGYYDKDADRIQHLAIPNRWLVTRTQQGRSTKRWVIESDYKHPEGVPNTYGAIAYPVDLLQNENAEQPFCYLGRQIHIDQWHANNTTDNYLQEALTAVGYGEPTFAAFYPNCHSVLGCHDAGYSKKGQLEGLQYDLLGWYADEANDPLYELVRGIDLSKITGGDAMTRRSAAIKEAIQEKFHWTLGEEAIADPDNFAPHIFCHAQLQFQPSGSIANPTKDEPVRIAMGNTPTEALSAYLAKEMEEEGHGQKQPIEEQLEAVHLFKELSNKKLDIAAKFKEAVHRKGFTAVSGGTLWKVTAKNNQSSVPNPTGRPTKDPHVHASQVTLPEALSHSLNELNGAQQKLDRKREEVISLRGQLYSDWYRYMLAAYPPDEGQSHPPNIEAIKLYIEARGIEDIDKAIKTCKGQEENVTRKRALLSDAIRAFNESEVSATAFFQLFDQDTVQINSHITFNGTPVWADNLPFSEKALEANGTDFWIEVAQPEPIQAISLWVYIAGGQSIGDTCLLNLTGDPAVTDAKVARSGIGAFWRSVHVNGVRLDPYLDLDWLDIPKDRWTHLYLEAEKPFSGTVHLMSENRTDHFTKGKLAGVRFFSDPLSEDEIFADMNMLGQHRYELQVATAGRYWQPNEPVVLLAGEGMQATKRHGSDGLLACHVAEANGMVPPADPAQLTTIRSKITVSDSIAFSTWEQQPWHPFMLEWKAEVFPISYGNNINQHNDGKGRNYDPDFINHNFELVENATELNPRTTTRTAKAVSIYSGTSILTPHAKLGLIHAINTLLENLTPSDLYQITPDAPDVHRQQYSDDFKVWFKELKDILWNEEAKKEELTADNLEDFKKKYEEKPVYLGAVPKGVPYEGRHPKFFEDLSQEDQDKNTVYRALLAYGQAQDSHFLAQSLGGFNAGLLMHRQRMQLPIAEPLGFDKYAAFTDTVRAYVGQESKIAPLVYQDFNPIRSGSLNLLELNLVDTFGQVKSNFDEKKFVTLESLKVPERFRGDTERDHMRLSPAFVQPTRLNVRWLAADNGEQEMNSHPASSPVCGWLLPNNLNRSLMVYDQQGDLLGLINVLAQWESAPGNEQVLRIQDIPNPYLRTVVHRLTIAEGEEETAQRDKRAFLEDMITVLDRALETIDPENFAQHQDLALLMGRPIAVVRASIDLQLKGRPALNQSWNSFRKDMAQTARDTDKFEEVTIPIRIGDRGQLNDGVIGFWKEDHANQLGRYFHTTVARYVNPERTKYTDDVFFTNKNIKAYEEGFSAIHQSIASAPQRITLLMDPRAKVHATTGILPTKVVDLPVDQYEHALRRLKVTFLSAPILTPQDSFDIPLPEEAGYTWSWLQRERAHWREVSKVGMLVKDTVVHTFERRGVAIWEELKRVGWIKEVTPEKATIIPENQRKEQTLDHQFLQDTDAIQGLLDKGHISGIETQAVFAGRSEAKEGWLQLKPNIK